MKSKRYISIVVFFAFLVCICCCKADERKDDLEKTTEIIADELESTQGDLESIQDKLDTQDKLEDIQSEQVGIARYISDIVDCEWDAEYMSGYFMSATRYGLIGTAYENDALSYRMWINGDDGQMQIRTLKEIPQGRMLIKAAGTDTALYLITQTIDTSISRQEKTYLSVLSYEGTLLWEKNLTEVAPDSEPNDIQLYTDIEGDIWLMDVVRQYIFCLSQEGELLGEIDGKEQNIGSLVQDKNGCMYGVSVQTTGETYLYCIGKAEGSLAEPVIIEKKEISDIYPGVSGEFMLKQGRYLIDYHLVSQEEMLICDLVNVGVYSEKLLEIKAMQDGSILLLLGQAGVKEGSVVRLTKEVTLEGLQEEIQAQNVTLACLQANDLLREIVAAYNRGNHGYVVQIKEYYDTFQVDADIQDALNRLNADLTDGTAGDVLDLTSLSQYAVREKYVRSGVLEELYQWIDRDPSLKREDYLLSLWKANEIQDGLYNLVPLYTVNTKIGTASEWEVDDTFTLEEMLSAEMSSYVFGLEYLQNDFWHDFCVFYMQDLEQIPAQETLAAVLEFASQLPKEWKSELSNEYSNALYEHKKLLTPTGYCYEKGILRNLMNYREQMALRGKYLLNEEIDETFREFAELGSDVAVLADFRASQGAVPVSSIGFPSENSCGSSFVNLISLGICTASQNKNGAWDFFRYTLSDEAQYQREQFEFYTLPAKYSIWNEVCETNCIPDWSDFVSYGGGTEDGTLWEVVIPTLSKEVVLQFNALLEEITVVDEVNPLVLQMIQEEADSYAQGLCSAQEAAAAILNRLMLYQSESE